MTDRSCVPGRPDGSGHPHQGNAPLLSVRDLRVSVRDTSRYLPVVRGISFDVQAGEVLAVIGESGAGKSMAARAILGLSPHGARVEGEIRYAGKPVTDHRALWGRRIAFVPQDALTVLSPVHTVGDQLAAAVRSVTGAPRRVAHARAVAALQRIGIADAARRARAYPHEFSGGMRQRAVIAMAMVNEPELLVADEPTSALDPLVQQQVLGTLAAVREQTGTALLLVTHDLAVVAEHADRMLVMYAGRMAEVGPVRQVLAAPRAPYTAGLIASLPPTEVASDRRLLSIGGAPPAPGALPDGCAFAPRCPLASALCGEQEPALRGGDTHAAACHHDLPAPATSIWSKTA